MQLFDLKGKVAVITGGNGGLGRGMAQGLAQAGACIGIIARDEEKSNRAAAELRQHLGVQVSVQTADVGDDEQAGLAFDAIAAELGGVDILVNNAGTSVRGAPEELNLSDYDQVMNINLTAALRCSQCAHPHMKKAGSGKIINIGSMTSIFGSPFSLPYAVSKGGMVQMTKSLAIAWAKDNIQVNCILPGWFETELTAATRKHVPGLFEKICERTPAGHWGKPEDLAGTAVFLASKASDFVTGASLSVDGGFSVAF